MIRSAMPEDRAALVTLAVETGMFSGDELEALEGMVEAYFGDAPDPGSHWVVHEAGGTISAAALYAPEMMAEDVWNLLFIGVRGTARRQGLAGALLAHVETAVAAEGARLLIVETSGLDAFAPARRLYRKHGYDEEARIRDFYRTGDDKIVFRKAM